MLLETRKADIGLRTGIITREIARTSRLVSPPHRLRRPAQQGDRRPQRVRARVRHPPGRRAQGAHDLRDHGRDARSAWTPTASCWASTPAATRSSDALEQLGYTVDGAALNQAFKRFKEVADRKKQVTAMDLEALVTDELREAAGTHWTLEWFEVEASNRRPPHARVGAARRPTATRSPGDFTGDGPVDAIFRAINAATRRDARLREFRIESVTGGQDALGEASVVLELAGQSAAGPGRLDRHHRGGRARLRARAVQLRARACATRAGAPGGRDATVVGPPSAVSPV